MNSGALLAAIILTSTLLFIPGLVPEGAGSAARHPDGVSETWTDAVSPGSLLEGRPVRFTENLGQLDDGRLGGAVGRGVGPRREPRDRRGQHDRARRFYRVVRNLDSRRKWTWEVDVLSGGADSGPSEATP